MSKNDCNECERENVSLGFLVGIGGIFVYKTMSGKETQRNPARVRVNWRFKSNRRIRSADNLFNRRTYLQQG